MGKSEGKTSSGNDFPVRTDEPGPWGDPVVSNGVWSKYRVPLAVARKLALYIDGTCRPDWAGRPIRTSTASPLSPDQIVAMEFSRSITSYRAALDLIALGYNDQAHMVCRSLFEGFLVALWVHQNEDEAIKRFGEASRLADYLDAKLGVDMDWVSPEYLEKYALDEDEIKRLSKEYGDGGQKLWTKPSNPYGLIENFTGLDSNVITSLKTFRKVAYQSQNRAMHSTPASLISTIGTVSSEGISLRMGPKVEDMEPAIHAGWWTFGGMADLIMDRFDFPMHAEYQEWKEKREPVFRPIYEDQVSDVERNDDCPCESGRKYKKCHLDRVKPRAELEPS